MPILKQKRWVGLGLKPDFFIYFVKPEPNSSPTYLMHFPSLKKTERKVYSLTATRARKNQAILEFLFFLCSQYRAFYCDEQNALKK
jgi:hypothetical protein